MADAKKTAMTKKSSSKRSRSTKKNTKLEPAVRYLRYDLVNSATPDTETSHFLDLAKDLSMVNRRLMRQGRVYHIKKITVVSRNTPNVRATGTTPPTLNAGRISASVIPSSWVAHMAWKRGFKVWQKMYSEASENLSGDVTGTWSDFKVFMSNDMRAGSVLSPIDNGGNPYTTDEWAYANYVTPDGTTGADPFEVHMMGDHNGNPGAWNSISLIKSYGESRATVNPADPNVPGTASDDPLVNVFDYGTTVDEVVNIMESFNDFPPYALVDYPGADVNGPKPIVAQQSCLSDGRTTLAGFEALCGLIELESSSPISEDTYSVLVELAPGKYRGIKAEVI